VFALVEQDFPENPAFIRACAHVISFIESKPLPELRHLTFGFLSLLIENHELVSSVIAYLAGDRARLLDMRFEFIDEDEIYNISPEEINEARMGGGFIHPTTGKSVENFEHYIYIYFVPFGAEMDSQ
jgi:hypothetical protein